MNDSISRYAGIAALYSSLPLSSLREIEGILSYEISRRLEGFGVYNCEANVADVESKNVVNQVENNVVIGKFGRGNQ